MKKIALFLLLAISVLICLCACGATAAVSEMESAVTPIPTPEPTPEPPPVTRGEMENALVNSAFAYYLKGNMIQYDMTSLNRTFDREHGGPTRLSQHAMPEEATIDTNIYTVCAEFCEKVYEDALGYRMMNSDDTACAKSSDLFHYSQSQPEALAGEQGSKSILIARYVNSKRGFTEEEVADGFVWTEGVDLRIDEFYAFLSDYEHNLRPGDLFVAGDGLGTSGHTMMYIGRGFVMDFGGRVYDMQNGKDLTESRGIRFWTMETLFLNKENPHKGGIYLFEKGNPNLRKWFAVIRPLDWIVTYDGDGNPENDPAIRAYRELPAKAETRDVCKGLTIDRTVSVSPYGTTVRGETLTYSIILANQSNQEKMVAYEKAKDEGYDGITYENLPVWETVPEGTVLNEESIADNGGKFDGKTVSWDITLAPGESITLSYEVTVSAGPGETVVNGGGFVGNIPSNVLTTTVGRGNAVELAGRAFALLPDTEEIIEALFENTKITAAPVDLMEKETIIGMAYVLKEREQVADEYLDLYDKMIPGFYGGRKVWTPNGGSTILEFRENYLQPGDYIVAANVDEDGYPTVEALYLYTGNGALSLGDNSGVAWEIAWVKDLESLFTYDVFFLLRQSK